MSISGRVIVDTDKVLSTPFLGPLIQVCTVTTDLHAVVAGYVALGVGPFGLYHFDTSSNSHAVYKGRPAKFRYDCAVTEDHMWEVSQPIEGDSMFSDFLAETSGRAGYQHLAVRPSIPYDEVLEEFERRGFETIMSMTHWGQVRVTYVSNEGMVIEVSTVPSGFTMPPPDEWLPAPG